MAIDKKHIRNIFKQKFSLFDYKELVRYFETTDLNDKARFLIKDQWMQFVPDPEEETNLDHVFYKLYYTISKNDAAAKMKTRVFKFSQIAAILIVGLLIATSIYFSDSFKEKISTQQVEFISKTGFRNKFKLPDGTTGWLGNGSELKYHVDSNDKRIVDLNGLAFFDVTHQKDQPFIVNTPAKLKIEVLGTRFNVSAYSEYDNCEVVLEKGRVRLNINNETFKEMVPNERILFNSKNNTIERSIVNVEEYLAWKDGILILNDVSLKEACIKLSRFYNVDFELETKDLENQEIRLVLGNETLDDALTLLTMISPVKYQIEERKALDDNSYSRKRIIIINK